MFNRYIGNTGQVYRVEEERDRRPPPPRPPKPHAPRAPNVQSNSPGSLPGRAPGGFGELTASLRRLLTGLLPEGHDLGDLLLILILLLLYLEKEDEELLVILSVLLFTSPH